MSTTSLTPLDHSRTASLNGAACSSCSKCGAELALPHHEGAQAQQRIQELEAQIKLLTLRATEAVERATDYEDALKQFTSATPSPLPSHIFTTTRTTPHPPPRPASAASEHPPLPGTAATLYPPARPHAPPNSRLSRLLPTRRSNVPSMSTAPLQAPPLSATRSSYPYPHTAGLPSTETETELLTALTREQTLRLAAESAVSQTNEEIEELTGQLFQQANEMVATERKARARLEERVAILEKRDGEKQKRLEALEGRLGRIERVRGLLREREREREDSGDGDQLENREVQQSRSDDTHGMVAEVLPALTPLRSQAMAMSNRV
ncbi:hypothetical protein MMC13_007563 [Lambiella insularis]|nr:hypothetical protein [Lambiella insularis]